MQVVKNRRDVIAFVSNLVFDLSLESAIQRYLRIVDIIFEKSLPTSDFFQKSFFVT